jgi:hypothetical protein
MKRIVLAVIIGVAVLLTVLGLNRRNEAQRIRGSGPRCYTCAGRKQPAPCCPPPPARWSCRDFSPPTPLSKPVLPTRCPSAARSCLRFSGGSGRWPTTFSCAQPGEDIVVAESRRAGGHGSDGGGSSRRAGRCRFPDWMPIAWSGAERKDPGVFSAFSGWTPSGIPPPETH